MLQYIRKTLPTCIPPRAIRVVLYMPVLVVLLGTCGYMTIEGWTFWQSLFFTLVTLTTVGYGDYGLSEAGERFTAIMLILGIGTVTFSFGRATQWVVSEALHPQRRMRSRAMRLRDHFIICGYGSIGSGVADNLLREGCQVAIVDPCEDMIEPARELGRIAVVGDATDDAVLRSVGIDHARAVLALTTCDATNIVVTLSARALRDDVMIVARADDEQNVVKLERAGADHVMNLDPRSSRSISDLLIRPHVSNMLFQPGDRGDCVRLGEFQVASSSSFVGKTMKAFGEENPSLVIIGMKRGDDAIRIRPAADTTIASGDIILIAGGESECARFEHRPQHDVIEFSPVRDAA